MEPKTPKQRHHKIYQRCFKSINMDTIRELSNTQAPQKTSCENCGKETICYMQGSITPITRQLLYEEWLCGECVA